MKSLVPLWLSWLSIAVVSLVSLVAGSSVVVAAEPVSIAACQFYRFDSPVGTVATWEIPDADVETFHPQGGSALVGRAVVIWVPSPRRLPVIRRVTTKDGKQVAELIDLRVTGEQPGPLPVKPDVKPVVPPTPTPTPDVKPDVKLSPFAQKVFDEASKVQSPDRAAQARKIADALAAVRSKIVAGAVDTKSPGNVVKVISEQTGKQPAVWSGWIRWWNVNAKAEWETSGLMTPANWIRLLDTTIEGLSAVK